MNKKAQLGRIITTIPIMILVIVIIGFFIIMSAGIFAFKGKTSATPTSIHHDNLLLQQIKIEINGQEEEMLILDAAIKMIKGEISESKLKESLKPLVNKQHPCLFLTPEKIHLKKGSQNIRIGYIYKNGEVLPNYYYLSTIHYNELISETTLNINGENKEISAYYGPCKTENE